MKFSIICLVLALGVVSATETDKNDIKNLSSVKKLALHAISKLRPELFQNGSPDDSQIKYIQYGFIDAVYTDLRSLLIQIKDLPPKSTEFPNLDWHYHWESEPGCSWFCWDFWLSLTSDGYIFEGLHNITSETKFTPNTIQNTFSIPNFKLKAPSLLFNWTFPDEGSEMFEGLDFIIDNMLIETSMKYDYVPDVGLQVSNLSIDFNTVDLDTRFRLHSVYLIYPDGEVEVVGENYETPYTEYMISDWEEYQVKYQDLLQLRINCVLSGNRVSKECVPEGDYAEEEERYYASNVFQLINTFGLGSAQKI